MIDNLVTIFLIVVICFFLIRHLKFKKHIEDFSNKIDCETKFDENKTGAEKTIIKATVDVEKLYKDCDSRKLTSTDFDSIIDKCKVLGNLDTLENIKYCIDYLTDENKKKVITTQITKITTSSDIEELIGKISDLDIRNATISSINPTLETKQELKIKLLADLLKDKREELTNASYNENPKNTKIEYLNKLEAKLEKDINKVNNTKKKEMQTNFNKIQNLTKIIEHLNHNIKLNQISNVRAKTIKSLQNGLKLSISEMDKELCSEKNPKFRTTYLPDKDKNYTLTDKKNAKLRCLNDNSMGKNVYLVNLNDNCLEVNGSGDYSLKPCNLEKKQQYFVLKDVYNPEIYKSHFEKSSLKPLIPKNLKYPFSMVKSLNSDSCLQNFNNDISIQPCGSKKSQRWKKIEKEKYC